MDPTDGLLTLFSTVLRMLHDREYIIPKLTYTRDEFIQDFCESDGHQYVPQRERMTLSLIHKADRGLNMRVFFCSITTKIGKGDIEKLLANMGADRTRAMFIFPDACVATAQARKVVNTMNRSSTDVLIEIFSERELMSNITANGKIEREYSIYRGDPQKVPLVGRIPTDDPVARYFGLKRGEILRIVSTCEAGGRMQRFRRCVYPEEIDKKEVPLLGRDK